MSVHKEKRGTWEVNFRGFHKRGFRTKSEAEKYEAKIKLEGTSNYCNVSISTIAEDYLELLRKEVSFSTYHKCYQAMNNIILPLIEDKKINKITDSDCRKFHEALLELKYSSRYKNYLQNKYTALFKHARKYFNYNSNPEKHLSSFKKSYDEKKAIKDKESRVWSDEEFNAFISCVENDIYRLLFITLYYTGLRIGEAQALTWNDFQDNKIIIDKSLCKCVENKTYEIKDTKTESSIRKVTIPEGLSSLLRKRMHEEMSIPGFQSNWFIFGRNNPLPRTTIDRIKNDAIKKSGVKKITLHDFRHSHASNLIANGINIVAVSKRLGHSDINMTMKVYAHLMEKNESELSHYIEKSYQNLTRV